MAFGQKIFSFLPCAATFCRWHTLW